MEIWTTTQRYLDTVFIYFFRLPEIPILGYYLGCVVLAIACVILGQLTIATVFYWNQRFIDRDNRQMIHFHNLSIMALISKDKTAFKNCNKAANDLFGKVFFSQIALSASSLWPIAFAAGWLQSRFQNVQFPLPWSLPIIGDHVGFMFTFLPIYILVYILFGNIKKRLPLFRSIFKRLAVYDSDGEEKMIRLSELSSIRSENRTSCESR